MMMVLKLSYGTYLFISGSFGSEVDILIWKNLPASLQSLLMTKSKRWL